MTLRFFLKDPLIRYPLAAAFILAILQIIVIAVRIKPQAEPIFLHYTTYFGVDLVGAWYLLYAVPAMSILISVINAVLSNMLARRNSKALGAICAGAAAVVGALFTLAVFLLVRLNA